jgi:DNA-binding NarL/FixJ family response regulator
VLALAGGFEPDFIARLREACVASDCANLVADAATPQEFSAALALSQPSHRLVAVIHGRWLKAEGLDFLIEMRRHAPGAACLAVDADLDALALIHALRLGLRGLASDDDGVDLIARALSAIARGEIWLSRQRLLEAMMLGSPPHSDKSAGQWVNLPTLTQRERDVLMGVLEGLPNKLIARKLEVSEQTVKIHLVHVYRKLGVHRRVDLLKAFSDDRPFGPPAYAPKALLIA